jgi:hypothetical protein
VAVSSYKTPAAVTTMAVLVCGLAACGGSPSVQGSLTDSLITTKSDCAGNALLQIALTNASGQIIARDNSAPFTWAGNACMIEFSFSDTPRLPGYGVRVLGLGAGTTWLTPAQASQPVKLSIGPGFAVPGS